MRAIVIAGTHSGCGKTTVTLGLLAALRKQGKVVQPFKAGPDFIDAGLHRLVTGRPSRNLDTWMCGQDYVIDCFNRHAAEADVAVIEGVMGMHDGGFSTASLAGLLHAPVILVVDAYGMAESAGAVVKGFKDYKRGYAAQGVPISGGRGPGFFGVIFNRASSEAHFNILKNSVENVAVVGWLPKDLDFEIPHRHLGLAVAEENPLAAENIGKLAAAVSDHIDIDLIVRNAELRARDNGCVGPPGRERATRDAKQFKVALAYDRAFCFYYEDNLDALIAAGADIVRFSPLSDRAIPLDADAVYIGGGYPELCAAELSGNASMLSSIGEWSSSGRPLYAECGGMMYLSRGVRDFNGAFFPMAGVFPFATEMRKKPRIGYREITMKEDCILGNTGETCRGHEFHYSIIEGGTADAERGIGAMVYSVRDNRGRHIGEEGFRFKNTFASYIHLHFGSNCRIAEKFSAFVKGDRIA